MDQRAPQEQGLGLFNHCHPSTLHMQGAKLVPNKCCCDGFHFKCKVYVTIQSEIQNVNRIRVKQMHPPSWLPQDLQDVHFTGLEMKALEKSS